MDYFFRTLLLIWPMFIFMALQGWVNTTQVFIHIRGIIYHTIRFQTNLISMKWFQDYAFWLASDVRQQAKRWKMVLLHCWNSVLDIFVITFSLNYIKLKVKFLTIRFAWMHYLMQNIYLNDVNCVIRKQKQTHFICYRHWTRLFSQVAFKTTWDGNYVPLLNTKFVPVAILTSIMSLCIMLSIRVSCVFNYIYSRSFYLFFLEIWIILLLKMRCVSQCPRDKNVRCSCFFLPFELQSRGQCDVIQRFQICTWQHLTTFGLIQTTYYILCDLRIFSDNYMMLFNMLITVQ